MEQPLLQGAELEAEKTKMNQTGTPSSDHSLEVND